MDIKEISADPGVEHTRVDPGLGWGWQKSEVDLWGLGSVTQKSRSRVCLKPTSTYPMISTVVGQ